MSKKKSAPKKPAARKRAPEPKPKKSAPKSRPAPAAKAPKKPAAAKAPSQPPKGQVKAQVAPARDDSHFAGQVPFDRAFVERHVGRFRIMLVTARRRLGPIGVERTPAWAEQAHKVLTAAIDDIALFPGLRMPEPLAPLSRLADTRDGSLDLVEDIRDEIEQFNARLGDAEDALQGDNESFYDEAEQVLANVAVTLSGYGKDTGGDEQPAPAEAAVGAATE